MSVLEYEVAPACEPIALSRWRPSPSRLARLLVGLWLFGVGEALLIASGFGNSPWSVLAQGAARHLSISVGTATILISGIVLCAWVPLRQKPGLGTFLNATLIGVAINVTLALLPARGFVGLRLAMVPAGVLSVSVGSGMYLSGRLGPGPRDGLMTGLHRRTGRSLRLVRAMLELTVTVSGILLGGTFGFATIVFALSIGPAVQFWVHRLDGRETRSF